MSSHVFSGIPRSDPKRVRVNVKQDGEGLGQLLELRSAIDSNLRSVVDQFSSHSNQLHFATESGSRTRPLAVLLSCIAVGEEWQRALSASVALELAHKASIIRDDLADDDFVRRGRESFHVRYGLGESIATSDLLCATAFNLINAESNQKMRQDLLDLFIKTYLKMAHGQLLDVIGTEIFASDSETSLSINELKSGSLFELAFRTGALIGGGSLDEISSLALFGRKAGTAFQILNDVDNFLGAEPGRVKTSDIIQHKHSMMVEYALSSHIRPSRDRLLMLLRPGHQLSTSETEEIREIIIESGSVEHAEKRADILLQEGKRELERLCPSWAKHSLMQISTSASFRMLLAGFF